MSGFLLIMLVAIIAGGIGYMFGRRSAERQQMMFPAGQVPLQQRDGPKEYYQPYNNDMPGRYPPQQQGYMPQQQGYMPQQSQGMNPLVAGGLGVAAGGLMGYGLGQAMADDGSEGGGDAAPAEDSFMDGGDLGGDW